MTIENDKQIVDEIMKKDERVLFSFIREHEEKLFFFINKQIKNKQKSEEIVQDTFVDFIDALRNFQYQSSLKTFLYSIAKHKIIDSFRKKKIKQVLFSSLPDYIIDEITAIKTDCPIEQKEVLDKIQNIFDKLPNEYSTVLRLKYIERLKVKQISSVLSITFKATESLIFRARKAFIKLFVS